MEGLHGTELRLIKCTRSDTVGVDPEFRDSAPRTDGVFNRGSHIIAFSFRPRTGKVLPSGSTRNLPLLRPEVLLAQVHVQHQRIGLQVKQLWDFPTLFRGGCGSGGYALYLAEKVGCRLVGLDASDPTCLSNFSR